MDPEDPDLELLERWRGGDQRAGGKLLERHFNGLRIYFIGRIPEEDAADLIQDVFERMVKARDRFEGRSTLRTYLFHIAQHVLFENLRRRHRPNREFDPLSESIADISGRTQSSILAESEELQLLLDALRNIPSAQQDIVELYYFHDMTLVELARLYEIPEGTMKSRMSAARRRLLETFNTLADQSREDATLEEFLASLRASMQRGRPRP